MINLLQRHGRGLSIRHHLHDLRQRKTPVQNISFLYQSLKHGCGLDFVLSSFLDTKLAIFKPPGELLSAIQNKRRLERDLYFEQQKKVLMIGLPLLLFATICNGGNVKPVLSIISSSEKRGGGLSILSQCKPAGKLSMGLCIRSAPVMTKSLFSGLVWSQCVSVIQRVGRGYYNRTYANRYLCETTANCAAVSIQSWWRGVLGRRKACRVRTEAQQQREAAAHYDYLQRTFPPGSWIKAFGLQQSQYLNGKHARVVRWRVEDVIVTFLSPRKTAAVPIKNVRGLQGTPQSTD
eukprot:TRINITY_DN23441_c0_g1_i1.p1 TRINITY_DN23441_c0_g1~~TRINITY_DN23441_c0_g1_i1.p1  ORF type:complete len:342 (+),score=35.80 TRINITY_DN23441_c0_g1_i1:152-1027(+)